MAVNAGSKTAAGRVARRGMRAARMAAEIQAAAAVTLAHRVPALLQGAIDPRLRDDAESRRMVVEKVEAGREVSMALARGAAAGGAILARGMWRQADAQAKLMASMLTRKSGRAPKRRMRQSGAALALSQSLAWGMLASATRTMQSALVPTHRKVTANARRLSKKKPAKS